MELLLLSGSKIMANTQFVKSECPLGLCNGSGINLEGDHDDVREEKCLCVLEEEVERGADGRLQERL